MCGTYTIMHGCHCTCLHRMDAPLVNVFVSELFKFSTDDHSATELLKPQQQLSKTEDDADIPKLTSDELIQLQDQMRKVLVIVLTSCTYL